MDLLEEALCGPEALWHYKMAMVVVRSVATLLGGNQTSNQDI